MKGLAMVRPLDLPQVAYVNSGSMVLRAAYWHGIQGYEGVMADVWIYLCRHARSVLEVGGNVGFFAVLGARESDADYQVFEPVPRIAEQLILNLQLNGLTHVRVVQAAVVASAKSDFVFLNIPVEGDAMPVGAHLTEDTEVFGRTTAQVIKVAARAFPDLVDAVDLIKIDAEGIEATLLESAMATLERKKPTLVIELLPQAVHLAEVLRDLALRCGYSIWIIPGWGSDEIVCVEPERLTAELPQRYNSKDVVLSVKALPP
jgi:FkbM family methyltransferase